MPSAEHIADTVNRYVSLIAKGSADDLVALFADDATVEDPVGGEVQFLIPWQFMVLGHAAFVGLRPRAPVMPWTAPGVGRFHRWRWSLSNSRQVFSRERGPVPCGSGRERLDATVLDAFTSA